MSTTLIESSGRRAVARAMRHAIQLPLTGGLAGVYRLATIALALLVVSSSAGILLGSQALYANDATLRAFIGQDVVNLLVAAPLLAGAIATTRRRSLRALLLMAGVLAYVAYSSCFYLAGVPFGPLFAVHAALVGSSAYALTLLLSRLDVSVIRVCMEPQLPSTWIGLTLFVIGSLFGVAWLASIASSLYGGTSLGTVNRMVYALDLVVALPATIAVGVALLRRRSWGFAFAAVPLVLIAILMTSLIAGSLIVARPGDRVSSSETLAYLAALSITLPCLVLYFRAVRHPHRP